MNTFSLPNELSRFTAPSIVVPTTQQQPARNTQSDKSTMALMLALSIGALTGIQELPPTYSDVAKIITPSRFVERRDLALSGYEVSQSQVAVVNEYLHQHMTSRDFLREVAFIIDGIYGAKVIRDIHVVEDVDTGKSIMELTIKSGLPLDDDFEQKDQLLFQRLDAFGLASGLRDVVISQG